MTSFMTLDGVTSFYACKTLQLHVNVCNVALVLARVLQYNGGKLEGAEGFECVFVVYCVLESK